MELKITYATNFIRIFRLPIEFPSDYCFQGGHPTLFQLIDWFNPFDQRDFWNDQTKETDGMEKWYLEHIDELIKFIKGKRYFDPQFTYLAITDYGDAFVVNPEGQANKLQKQYELIKNQAIKDRNSDSSR